MTNAGSRLQAVVVLPQQLHHTVNTLCAFCEVVRFCHFTSVLRLRLVGLPL